MAPTAGGGRAKARGRVAGAAEPAGALSPKTERRGSKRAAAPEPRGRAVSRRVGTRASARVDPAESEALAEEVAPAVADVPAAADSGSAAAASGNDASEATAAAAPPPAPTSASASDPQPTPDAAPAPAPAAAPTAAVAADPAGSSHHVQEMVERKAKLTQELMGVEKQIFDLETKYLENSSGVGQALRGYALTLTPSTARRPAIKPADRLFSLSSVTGTPLT